MSFNLLIILVVGLGLTVLLSAKLVEETNWAVFDKVPTGIEQETWHAIRNNLKGISTLPVLLSTVTVRFSRVRKGPIY